MRQNKRAHLGYRRNVLIFAFLLGLLNALLGMAPGAHAHESPGSVKLLKLPTASHEMHKVQGQHIDVQSWAHNDFDASITAFLFTCESIKKRQDINSFLHPHHHAFGKVSTWQKACSLAQTYIAPCLQQAESDGRHACFNRVGKRFFKHFFTPLIVGTPYNASGDMQGGLKLAFSPEIQASQHASAIFSFPLVEGGEKLGEDLRAKSRGEIISDARLKKIKSPFWIRPIDSLFLSPAHALTVVLANGEKVTLVPQGRNNFPNIHAVDIFRQRGEIPLHYLSAAGIYGWLSANGALLNEVTELNTGYIFFKRAPPEGASTFFWPLAGFSAFVDYKFYPLGMPLWVSWHLEVGHPPVVMDDDKKKVTFFNQKMAGKLLVVHGESLVAKGPQEVDIFVGSGLKAQRIAEQNWAAQAVVVALVPSVEKLNGLPLL